MRTSATGAGLPSIQGRVRVRLDEQEDAGWMSASSGRATGCWSPAERSCSSSGWRWTGRRSGGISGNNAFDYFFTGGIAYLLVVGAGVVTFLLAGGFVKAGTTPWPIIILGATAWRRC